MTYSSYLRAGTALDIQHPGERRLYRFFEMLPGILAWGTLGGAALASWLFPVPTAFFIMAFVVYWTTRSLYLSFHLRSGYKKMKIHEKEDWLGKLEQLKKPGALPDCAREHAVLCSGGISKRSFHGCSCG
ncbi:MAG: hypothetical protein HYV55_01790 [Parcubacteria group bacterium]|nr:hypothetical protein [Parcubacteria group bacterium]